ncbi:MAG: ROK family protein [Planctomycetota bacterium]
MRALGLDIGGSAVKAGAINVDGSDRRETTRETGEGTTLEGLLDALVDIHAELGPVDRIGIGSPGLLDRVAGRVLTSPNLPWMTEGPLVEPIVERCGLTRDAVAFENDANAAALGEFWLGAGREYASLLFVTLGTGVGGGLILDGELVLGAGLAGEVGHFKVDPQGPPCGCGQRGCVEALASATAARRRAREAGLPDDLAELNHAADSGDPRARELFRAVGYDLGYGLSAALNLLDLRTYVIGGGFSAAIAHLEPGIREGFARGSYGDRLEALTVLRASLGPSAGWIGAARAALDR